MQTGKTLPQESEVLQSMVDFVYMCVASLRVIHVDVDVRYMDLEQNVL